MFFEYGAGEETRTLDSHLGKVMLYKLSYTRLYQRLTSLKGPIKSQPVNIRKHF